MNVPFAPSAHLQASGMPRDLPPPHVGRPHPPHRGPRTVGDGTVTIAGVLKGLHESSDVLPERVTPRGEPADEPDGPPARKDRRKGPRRRAS